MDILLIQEKNGLIDRKENIEKLEKIEGEENE